MREGAHDVRHAGPHGNDDRYTLEEVVSSGMEGRLWRSSIAVDGHTFRVAVKEIHTQNLGDIDEWVRRWERQAELLRSLDHPNLVRVREVFRGLPAHRSGERAGGADSLFLVMNWADGTHLGIWADGRPVEQRLAVLAKVAAAIDHLHSGRDTNGVAVMHRDLKPANVIVDGDGNPRIVDFGFARLADGEEYTVVGSPHFMAPEVPLGAVPTPAADRYSFGCIVHTTLLGHRVPLRDPDAVRMNLASLHALGVEQRRIADLQRLLDPDPDRRPRDLAAWHPTSQEFTVPRRALATGVRLEPPPVLPVTPSPFAPSAAVHHRSVPGPASIRAGGVLSYPPTGAPSYPPGAAWGTYPPSVVVAAPERRPPWVAPLLVTVLLVAVVAAGATAFVVGGAGSTPSTTTTTTTMEVRAARVPDLAGANSDDAKAFLAQLGLSIGQDVVDATSAEAAGTVLRVDPPTGTELAAGSEVRLVVAGPTFDMPVLTGLTLDDALAALQQRGHRPDRVVVAPSDARGDQRIGMQRPLPGPGALKDARVDLSVRPDPAPTTTTTTTTTTGLEGPVLPPPTTNPVR